MVDLVVHMKYVLIDKKQVKEFREHTIRQRARFASDSLSDTTIRDDIYKETERHAKKWQALEREVRAEKGDRKWFVPKAKEVLSGNEHYKRIYRYGYDATSASLIHPLLNTGESDYYEIMDVADELKVQASYEAMTNASMVQIWLMHMAMGFYNRKASRVARDCLVTMIECLRREIYEYDDKIVAFGQVVAVGQQRKQKSTKKSKRVKRKS